MKNRILIVEDELVLQKNLCEGLAAEGFVIHRASTGKETWSLLDASSFEMALFDLGLPDYDGFELLEEVLKEYPNMRIIVMTGKASPEYEIMAKAIGASAFLSKPVCLARLRDIISALRGNDKRRFGLLSTGGIKN